MHTLPYCPYLYFQYLSNPDERLRWQASNLPADDLCVENAIMLRRFNRYPLIIDPSGQATEFLLNEYRDKKITKTRYVLLNIAVVIFSLLSDRVLACRLCNNEIL